jgi:hypothetical protein
MNDQEKELEQIAQQDAARRAAASAPLTDNTIPSDRRPELDAVDAQDQQRRMTPVSGETPTTK